ncbi:MAG: response regulator transcription factor, partial [Clostridia bacterium]|nr:response regulator transcription factor [Clostridia bacterium]
MIYVLEDETSIRKLVLYTLNSSGLEAKGCATAEEFWESMREEQPQLVLLDIMLPGEDGLSVLKKLRAAPATAKLPVMMLTAKSTEYDKVLGLDMGADDYLPKPFGMMELVARVRSLLRRAGADTKVVEYAIGGLYVSIPRHLVAAEGVSVNLTLKEFEVLTYL